MTSVSRLGDGVHMRVAYARYCEELKEGEDLVALVARARDNQTRANTSKMTSTQF
jgi:sulfur transfer complex TusBCD TusB component (DsrH family)